jgi:hypothetical protein
MSEWYDTLDPTWIRYEQEKAEQRDEMLAELSDEDQQQN